MQRPAVTLPPPSYDAACPTAPPGSRAREGGRRCYLSSRHAARSGGAGVSCARESTCSPGGDVLEDSHWGSSLRMQMQGDCCSFPLRLGLRESRLVRYCCKGSGDLVQSFHSSAEGEHVSTAGTSSSGDLVDTTGQGRKGEMVGTHDEGG